MKKTACILFTGVLSLSAVTWNSEQINETKLFGTYPIISLDAQDRPSVLFMGVDTLTDDISLMQFSRQTGTWKPKLVSNIVMYEFHFSYGMSFNASGKTYVSYLNTDTANNSSLGLYLASDSTGSFVSRKLTGSNNLCYGACLQLDPNGSPCLVYILEDGLSIELLYGWMDGGVFRSEEITRDINPTYDGEFIILDFVMVKEVPHVFYLDKNFMLFHASKSTSGWNKEIISPLSTTYGYPSADADEQGKLFVAYRAGEYLDSIICNTNKSGSWHEELAKHTSQAAEMGMWTSLSLDSKGFPHLIWTNYDTTSGFADIMIADKLTSGWETDNITKTPLLDEYIFSPPSLAVDKKGYGQIVYIGFDESYKSHIYYAKSEEPIAAGIVEGPPPPPKSAPLEIKGSTVRFDLSQSSSIRISLYDASGQKVKDIVSGFYPSGQSVVSIDRDNLPAGVYFARLESNGASANARMVLIK